MPVQYVIWLNNAIHADFGVSFFTHVPVSQLIAQRASRWSLALPPCF
jgi:ABC-type dipeptide/oligopeptide/nickel transport system permease component